jgi:hypothetical protein
MIPAITRTAAELPSPVSAESFGLLHEMIRSFTTLARTLNLSHAVKELGTTRQTVRRHIASLEQSMGVALFELNDRQYQLTEAGQNALPEAMDLLAWGAAWATGKSYKIHGMQYLQYRSDDGWCHIQHQKPLGYLFSSSGTMLRDVVRCWTEASANLEHDTFQAVRPVCTVFRRHEGHWLFTEVGDESSFVSLFGWKVARSAIGRVLEQMPGYEGFGRLADVAYDEVEATQSMRLDHVFTHLPLGEEGILTPICFERLLLGANFPDSSFAMISVVRRTYDLEIHGVSDAMLRQMPEEFVMP